MNKTFMRDLKASPYYERIFRGRDVIMLHISGSRLIGVTDERSDYDLVALTNGGERINHANEFLTYKGIKVHWSYVPAAEFASNAEGTLMSCFGEVQFSQLNEDAILYENPKYWRALCYLKDNKNAVSLFGIYGLAKFHKKLINSVLEAGEITEKHYCKFLYHLCYASYLALNEEPDKTLLAKIKRIRWQFAEDRYKAAAVERIRLLRDFVASHPVNVGEKAEAFDREIARLIALA